MTHEEFIEQIIGIGFEATCENMTRKWRHPSGVDFDEDGILDLVGTLGPGVYDETLKSLFKRTEPK